MDVADRTLGTGPVEHGAAVARERVKRRLAVQRRARVRRRNADRLARLVRG